MGECGWWYGIGVGDVFLYVLDVEVSLMRLSCEWGGGFVVEIYELRKDIVKCM